MRAGEILELNTFLAVAEAGRFAPAAVRLGVTPSAVSQSIRRLEQRLDTRLFTRTTRSVSLTEAGERLLRSVKPALDGLAVAERVVGHAHPARSRARISVSTVAMELLVAPVLADFRRRHDRFALEVVVDDRLTDPVAQRFDAVIRRGDALEKDMIARRLSDDDRLVLVASDDGLAAVGRLAHPRDLGSHRIVVRRPRSGATLPWALRRDDETVNARDDPLLVVDGASAARQYAKDGFGVALLARAFVQADLDAGRLRHVLPAWSWPLDGFALMYAHRGLLPGALRDLERTIGAARRGVPPRPDEADAP